MIQAPETDIRLPGPLMEMHRRCAADHGRSSSSKDLKYYTVELECDNRTSDIVRLIERERKSSVILPDIESTELHLPEIKPLDKKNSSLESLLIRLFQEAKNSHRDDSEENFIDSFIEFLEQNGESGVNTFARVIRRGNLSEILINRALKWLGRIEQPDTSGMRKSLLEEEIQSKSLLRRDGAALGLISMGPSSSLSILEEMHKLEKCSSIKEYLKKVVQKLRT